MKNAFIKKYDSKIQGTISCYDRVVLRGLLHQLSYSDGMSYYLHKKNVLLKDFPNFIKPYKNELHERAEEIAKQEGIKIEFIRKFKKVRKEDLVQKQIASRNLGKDYTGLICILSAMEACQNYVYYFDKKTKHSRLKKTAGKCLHYYYYFRDENFGLCYLRVPTWCPFQLQFYFNGHNWLARQLTKSNIGYELIDNAFVAVDDYEQAQTISDSLDAQQLHFVISKYAKKYCPSAFKLMPTGYHWSIMQAEYATDIIFTDNKTLGQIYDNLLNTLMHSIEPDDVAKFFGRKKVHHRNNLELDVSCKQFITQIQNKRHLVRRIKHRMGATSIKMYDKFGRVLRIETTTNNPSEFYHYRSVVHRDGTKTSKVAPVKKSIYSLRPLRDILRLCNNRYLNYIAAFDIPITGKKRLQKVTQNTTVNNRNYKGFNLFDKKDEQIFKAIADARFLIHGFRNKHIKALLIDKSTSQVSRIIKRLHVKKLIKKANKSYKYFLTNLGKKIIATTLNFKELICPKQLDY